MNPPRQIKTEAPRKSGPPPTVGLFKLKIALGALALAALAAAPASAGPFDDLAGRPYAEARELLIKGGISPVRMNHDDVPWVCRRGLCEPYPEVIDCSGTGVAACWFAYWDGRRDEAVVVITYGEEDLTVEAVRSPALPDERAKILGAMKKR